MEVRRAEDEHRVALGLKAFNQIEELEAKLERSDVQTRKGYRRSQNRRWVLENFIMLGLRALAT